MTKPIHILILADGRSPTTQSWVRNLINLNFKVSLVSSFECPPLNDLENFYVLPFAFSQFAGRFTNKKESQTTPKPVFSFLKKFLIPSADILQKIRYGFGPLDLYLKATKFKKIVRRISPDFIHALRIPFEGMLGRFAPNDIPFLVSTWGNDFTLHAHGSCLMKHSTRACLKRADGLTSDAKRDIQLAQNWGFEKTKPTLYIPGSGGVDLQSIQESETNLFKAEEYEIPPDRFWIVNARGFRPGYVHNDAFFAAIPKVIKTHPQAYFICPSLEGYTEPAWLIEETTRNNVKLLPRLPQEQLWALFKQCPLFISPSSHDGTPNSLLEAMACGCFPIAGDIDSIREWIEHGRNGFLVDAQNPQALADAIVKAIDVPEIRKSAFVINMGLIKEHAELTINQQRLKLFYNQFINKS